MATEIRVTIDLAGFGAFQAAAEAALREVEENSAEAITNDARDRAPVLTGYLRDHISWQREGSDVVVESEADYSAIVDEGGVNRPANPFFTGAVEAERARFAERVAEALAEVTQG